MRALIVEDGLSRQALAASRALHDAGWTVGIGTQIRRGLAASSRTAARAHLVPAPERDPDAFIAAVKQAVAEVGYDVVFGARDAEVMVLSRRRDEVPAVFPYPPHRTIVRVLDKLQLHAAAQRAGIAVPITLPATEEALANARPPLLVKARLHHTATDGRPAPARLETALALSRAEAARRAATIRGAGGEPLIQQRVPGRLMAFSVVADVGGRIVAEVQQEAEQVWPLGAGVSVRATTVPPDAALRAKVAALLAEVGWFGLAELQFMAPSEGEPQLIDFNPRFYGSLALAVAAGANLPAVWAAIATGRPSEGCVTAVPGARFQWLYGDLRRCVDAGRSGLPARVLDSLRYAAATRHSTPALRDPEPALRYLALVLRRAARRKRP